MSIPSSVVAAGTAREVSPGIYPGVVAYIAIAGVVLLLMMLVGVVLRLAQAEWLPVPPDLFYEMMTAHGAGMVGIAGLAGAGIMWHFLSRHVRLNRGILITNLVSFLAGVMMILAAIFLGGFGGGWTFLYPLPATSGGAWEPRAAALYLGGLLVRDIDLEIGAEQRHRGSEGGSDDQGPAPQAYRCRDSKETRAFFTKISSVCGWSVLSK